MTRGAQFSWLVARDEPRSAADAGPQSSLRAREASRSRPLAARAAARQRRAVRQGAGGHPRRCRAARLRADRHHPRDRALPSPHPLHPHTGVQAERSAPGAERRQDGVRILDARAIVCARTRHALLRARHEAALAAAQRLVQRCDRRGSAQGAAAARARPDHHPRHRRRRLGRERTPLGEPQAVEASPPARVLPRHRHDQPARGDAEDI